MNLSCLVIRTLPFYNRQKFFSPLSDSTAYTKAKEFLSRIDEIRAEQGLNTLDFPKISIADFCAGVSYKTIACRVQDGEKICGDGEPPIQVSLKSVKPVFDNSGKIYTNHTVVFSTNIPAFAKLECFDSATNLWKPCGSVSVGATNTAGGNDLIVKFAACTPIPEGGIPYRLTSCSACCNPDGSPSQNCAVKTFQVFPCKPDEQGYKAIGQLFKGICFDSPAATLICDASTRPNSIYQSVNALVLNGYYNDSFFVSLPNNLCKEFTVENLTGLNADLDIKITIRTKDYILSKLGVVASSAWSSLDDAKQNYYEIEFKAKAGSPIADANVMFTAESSCGGQPFNAAFVIAKALCSQAENLIMTKTCGDGNNITCTQQSELTLYLDNPDESILFATCPEFSGFWEIRNSSNNIVFTSATNGQPSNLLEIDALSASSVGLTSGNTYRIKFTHYRDINSCLTSCNLKIEGVTPDLRVEITKRPVILGSSWVELNGSADIPVTVNGLFNDTDFAVRVRLNGILQTCSQFNVLMLPSSLNNCISGVVNGQGQHTPLGLPIRDVDLTIICAGLSKQGFIRFI
jgi:hypothetical protein